MNQQEIDQRHLEYGAGDANSWFRNIPKLTRSFVFQRLVDSITAQFRRHEIPLIHFEAKELSPARFELTVNHHATVKIELGREVSDG